MFQYADLFVILDAHISNRSKKVLYVLPDKNWKKYCKEHIKVFGAKNLFFTVNEIWKRNALNGLKYKDYVFITK